MNEVFPDESRIMRFDRPGFTSEVSLDDEIPQKKDSLLSGREWLQLLKQSGKPVFSHEILSCKTV